MIPAPWAFQHSGQTFLKTCIPHANFSHILNLQQSLKSACYFTQIACVVLNVTVAVLTVVEEERDIQSRPQLYFTAGFFSAVYLLFIQAMLGYLHDNALFKVLLDGTGSFLFVQWFEPFTVVLARGQNSSVCSVPGTSTDSQTMQEPWELPMAV